VARDIDRETVQSLASRDVERLALRPAEGHIGDEVLRDGDASEQLACGEITVDQRVIRQRKG